MQDGKFHRPELSRLHSLVDQFPRPTYRGRRVSEIGQLRALEKKNAQGKRPAAIRACVASRRSGQIDKRLQHGIPDILFGPTPEADIDPVPLAVALVHVTP